MAPCVLYVAGKDNAAITRAFSGTLVAPLDGRIVTATGCICAAAGQAKATSRANPRIFTAPARCELPLKPAGATPASAVGRFGLRRRSALLLRNLDPGVSFAG